MARRSFLWVLLSKRGAPTCCHSIDHWVQEMISLIIGG